ncbi:MAG: hypothetical protein OHK0022_39270 [Roseiflexaceae bacterium]
MTKTRDTRPGGQLARHEITPAQALERLRAQGRLPQQAANEQARRETNGPQTRRDR